MKKHVFLIGTLGIASVLYLKTNINDTDNIEGTSVDDDASHPISTNSIQSNEQNSFENKLVTQEEPIIVINSPIHSFDQESVYLRNDPNELFPDAKILATPGLTESTYIKSLHSLFDEYALIVKDGGYPTGLNIEITNALLGKNKQKVALLSKSHPRINKSGELVDQWGTPYYFHLESLHDLTIHSAGIDRKMYTQDDILSEK